MITVSEPKTLDTPEAIGAHIRAEYARRAAAAPFKPGDSVRLTERSGLPVDMMVGDVGTMLLCNSAPGPASTVLALHRTGTFVTAQVLTENLEKVAG